MAALLGWALGLFGIGCWSWVGWSLGQAAAVQADQGRLLGEARSAVLREVEILGIDRLTDPRGDALEEGDLVGRIRIPDLGVSGIILAGSEDETLDHAVGHLFGTSLPGTGGNVVLAAHRSTYFRNLRAAEEGQVISITTPYGDYRYAIDTTFVVDPEDVWVLDPPATGEGEIVTLLTCFPFDFIGPAPQRFIARGRLVETPPAPSVDGGPRRDGEDRDAPDLAKPFGPGALVRADPSTGP